MIGTMRNHTVIPSRFAALLLGLLASAGVWAAGPVVRPAVGPGKTYPAAPDALLQEVAARLAQARPMPSEGRLMAIVAPHAPYQFTGAVLAEAFAPLKAGQFDRVIVLAPSHFASFEGCSIPDVDAFATPLGVVPVDRDAMRHMNFSTLVTMKKLRYGPGVKREPIHEAEYAVEALLPFLQARLGSFKLLPILLGQFQDATGRFNPAAIRAVADRLRALLDERTLLVVSTDFTHFGDEFRYQPFRGDVAEGVRRLDRGAFEHLVNLDSEGFQAYLERTGNPICGRMALHLLMRALPDRVLGTLAGHAISGDANGDYRNGISFAAIHYYDYGRRVRRPAPKPVDEAASAPRGPGVHLTNIGQDPASGMRIKGESVRAIPHTAPEPTGIVALPPAEPHGPRVLTNRPPGAVTVEPPPPAE